MTSPIRKTTTLIASVMAICIGCQRQTPPTTDAVTEELAETPQLPRSESVIEGEPFVFINDELYDIEGKAKVSLPHIPQKRTQRTTQGSTLYISTDEGALQAFSLPEARRLWENPDLGTCRSIVVEADHVMCLTETELHFVEQNSAEHRTVALDGHSDRRTLLGISGGVVVADPYGSSTVYSVESGQVLQEIAAVAGDRDQFAHPSVIVNSDGQTFCTIARLERELDVACYESRSARRLWIRRLEHTQVITRGNESHWNPYLYTRSIGQRHLLFSSLSHNSVTKGIVLSLETGDIEAQVDRSIAHFVEDRSGALRGLLSFGYQDEQPFVDLLSPDGTIRWSLPGHWGGDSVTPQLIGNRLVMAFFSAIATGSDLLCIDFSTSELMWRADVVQLMVDHSRYLNHVELSRRDPEIVMIGREAGGDYLQIFNIQSGERTFTSFQRPSFEGQNP